MRAVVYSLCAALVTLPVLYGFVIRGLSLLNVQVPYNTLFSLLFSFGSIVPPMFISLLPRPLVMVLGYSMLFLILRRCWLFFAKSERTPPSFVGFQKVLGYVGFWSFSLSVLVLLLCIGLNAGSGVPAGMLMIPAMFCVPWAFFITEITSFKRKIVAGGAV